MESMALAVWPFIPGTVRITWCASSLMAKKKRVKKDDKEQSRRFVETAKELGTDESGRSFSRVFKKITPQKDREK